MYPSYHTAPDLSRAHQAEIRAQRNEIRQAKLARAAGESEKTSGNPIATRLTRVLAPLARLSLRPKAATRGSDLRGAPVPRS
jgi:hypothetical protein